MRITHVFRGDEHVNNTPRQINIFRALGAPLPEFGHVPIILAADGQKLSKRRGAVSVIEYANMGYLPEAMINYLARLGWSHGDDELFSVLQMIEWFDGAHLAQSPAQWDGKKLDWVNAHYIKAAEPARLAALVDAHLKRAGIAQSDPRLSAICALYKDRCATLVELATWAAAYYASVAPSGQDLAAHVTDAIKPVLAQLASELQVIDWTKPAISDAIKKVVASSGVKMPQLAMPARLLLVGKAQAPSLDALLELFTREVAVARLQAH
jgi:glutamyl-tRNA synthetase